MIRITSFLHRDELYDVLKRWMYNDLQPEDAERITRLVAFNNAFVSRYLNLFSAHLFTKVQSNPFKTVTALVKGDLKDCIVRHPPYRNQRIDDLIEDYQAHPERYYRETPFSARLFFVPGEAGDTYIGSHRIKRVRRLAEKSARRIIDRIFEVIKMRADALADERARKLGIPRQSLVTRPEDMINEFTKAEGRFLDDLRNRRNLLADGEMVIHDVAGVKIITEDKRYQQIVDQLKNHCPDCEVIEVEPHTGRYNATNLIIRHTPSKDQVLARPLGEPLLKLMRSRGVDAEAANRGFAEFVRSGESQVHIEVIISNYQEMLESEIGRCMHEDRINEIRLRQEYRGQVAKNVEYLMEYVFAYAISPCATLAELPIKLWNRYLPDYFDDVVKRLWNIPPMHVVD